jgi:hypothetical protein
VDASRVSLSLDDDVILQRCFESFSLLFLSACYSNIHLSKWLFLQNAGMAMMLYRVLFAISTT